MDRRPTLEARPPVLINAVVRALIPPACREHVVGDLWERYRSPMQFVLDAARTVPFVIASQIRRTSTIGATIIQAFLMFVAFAASSGGLGPSVAAVVVARCSGLVLARRLQDAASRSLQGRSPSIWLSGAGGGLIASQAIVALTLPALAAAAAGIRRRPRVVRSALPAPPPESDPWRHPSSGGHARASHAGCPHDRGPAVRTNEREGPTNRGADGCCRRRVLHPAVGVFTELVSRESDGLWRRRTVCTWRRSSRGSARDRCRRVWDSASLSRTTVASSIRQHGWVRTMWLWYLLPWSPGMRLHHGRRCRWPRPSAADRCGRRSSWSAIVAGVGMIIHLGSQDMARKLRIRIDTLGSLWRSDDDALRVRSLSRLGRCLSALPALAQSAPPAGIAPDTEIRKILAERVDTYHQSVGIVVGVIEPAGRRIVTYGRASTGAHDAARRRHDLRDRLDEQGVHVAAAGRCRRSVARSRSRIRSRSTCPRASRCRSADEPITLQDLSTHTSGLPRLPAT